MTSTRFLAVRHGESTWNATGKWQGSADPPLSAHGRAQARRAAHRLVRYGPFDALVTSTLRRARHTGELLAAQSSIVLGDADSDLSERSAGAWEGHTRAEIEQRWPGWIADGRRPDGYEADESIVERVSAALFNLATIHPGGRVVVVSHGGVINALERSGDERWRRIGNLEARWFEIRDGNVTAVGDRIHLLDHDSPDPAPEPYA